mmetsp:Transcript_4047/g.8995  ORF Transcript_4047/g.8995 Transcript_4047/m.8995 type:complete len:401 (+) Transcript_4047:345-1547(+)
MTSFNEIAGNVLLFFLVFGMSATVDIYCMVAQLKNIKAIMMGVFLQFVVLPICGFLVVKFFELDRATGISILVVTSSPGGSYSNWWCSMFNADLALSVTMTAISTLASVILMPANLLLYCKFSYEADVVQSLDFNSLFIALTVVISAIGMGLFASAKIHSYRFNIFANKIGNYAGVSLVAFSALMSNTQGDTQIWEHTWQFYVAVMIPLLAALLIANALTSLLKMEKPERVTLAVECCYQNVGIATSVALTMFKGDELGDAMAVPLFYGFMEAFVLGIYCIITWKAGWTKAPSNVSFWTMIGTSYEVLLIEHSDLKAVEVSLPKNQKDMIEKKNRTGDTIYMKYNLEEGEEEEPMTFGCIHIPSHPKEASGFNLPEVPGEEREDGIHQTEFATKQGGVEC